MKDEKRVTILVPVDFSQCSRLALRKAHELLKGRHGHIVAIHVVDHHFIDKCVRHDLGEAGEIKKNLFLEAKRRLHDFLIHEEKNGIQAEPMVCEGEPFIEINKKAVELDAEMIVIGSCGKANDMNTIFFGSTAEKILRFITRPVLCVPPETDYKGVN
jgi:nucleotide-binding universal stress UspA family protein